MPKAKKARYDAKCPSVGQTLHHVFDEFRDVQEKLEHLTTQMSEEGLHVVRQVCQQYNALRAPHFASRAALLKKLPNFWTSVCTHHPLLTSGLSTDDIDVLQYLTDVTVKEYQDSQCGFRIEFDFAENPYFEEQQLAKVISFNSEGQMVVDGTPPTWREHMAPGGTAVEDGQKRKCEKCYSFFLWFSERGTIGGGQLDHMSLLFKDDIWPNPMQYYHHPEPVPPSLTPLMLKQAILQIEKSAPEQEATIEGAPTESCGLPSEPQTETLLPGDDLEKLETPPDDTAGIDA